MGCKQSRGADGAGGKYGPSAPGLPEPSQFPAPTDDVVPWVCPFGDGHFAASGVEGWVYFYEWQKGQLAGKFRAHPKSVNRILAVPERSLLLTASTDATVRLWRAGGEDLPGCGASGSSLAPAPDLTFEGHRMSVSALDSVGDAEQPTLFTGSRDCTVRTWDVATGKELHQQKTLRNVVTAVRRVPGGGLEVAQASEDLQLRLWDLRAAIRPASAVHGGPNQLICLDVSDDGRYVVCGSKGFSRENCEVKVFDVRGGLRQLSAAPVADQTIEALRLVGPSSCLVASKDGFLREVAFPEVSVVAERGPRQDAYTALGAQRDAAGGPVVMAASTGPEGPALEALLWSASSPAVVLASTG